MSICGLGTKANLGKGINLTARGGAARSICSAETLLEFTRFAQLFSETFAETLRLSSLGPGRPARYEREAQVKRCQLMCLAGIERLTALVAGGTPAPSEELDR